MYILRSWLLIFFLVVATVLVDYFDGEGRLVIDEDGLSDFGEGASW